MWTSKLSKTPTSLTGMDETPSSSAMNQQALELLSGCEYRIDDRENSLEIPAPSEYTLWERIILWELQFGYILWTMLSSKNEVRSACYAFLPKEWNNLLRGECTSAPARQIRRPGYLVFQYIPRTEFQKISAPWLALGHQPQLLAEVNCCRRQFASSQPT